MRISKITPIEGEHEIVDIEVDVDSSFVVHGCILHNSGICRSLDGKKIRFTDKVQPKPPFHCNCRTSVSPWLSPEFDIFDKGATRASNGATGGKPVSADLSYYEWLRRQPASFIDEVLGKTKGLIFRNSGLSANEFRKITIDDLGNPLTLKAMAERDKRVASYLSNK